MVGDIYELSGSTEVHTTLLCSVFHSKSDLNVFQSVGTGLFTLSGLLCSSVF